MLCIIDYHISFSSHMIDNGEWTVGVLKMESVLKKSTCAHSVKDKKLTTNYGVD